LFYRAALVVHTNGDETVEPVERVARLTSEGAFEVLAAAKKLEAAGKHVVHLEIGQPDFPTPDHIVEAGVKALRDGRVKYAPPAGIPQLRRAIADHLLERGVATTPENVVVTPGGKSALFSTMVAVIHEDTDVLLPDIGFPAYEAVARFLGADPVFYELDPSRGFTVTAGALRDRVTRDTRVLVLNSPHNPTGGSISQKDLEEIADFARERDLVVITDEIYSGLQYDGGFLSIQALPGMAERTAIVDGFSKTYAMTGWRLGYAVLPTPVVDPVVTLATNTFSCTATFIQHAGVAALTGPQQCVRDMCAEYSARSRFVASALNMIPGIRCEAPHGAFYAFPDVRGVLERTGQTVEELAHDLLHEYGVACLAGTAFGSAGEGYLRLSYANSRENIALGLERIQQLVAQLPAVAA
jgi:aspartate aminotransferase